MNKKQMFIKKCLSLVIALTVVLQSFAPGLFLLAKSPSAFAQEEIPTPTSDATPTPAPTQEDLSAQPTQQPSPTPTPEPTIIPPTDQSSAPSASPTPSANVDASANSTLPAESAQPTSTPTTANEGNPSQTQNQTGQPNAPPSNTPTPTPSPSPTATTMASSASNLGQLPATIISAGNLTTSPGLHLDLNVVNSSSAVLSPYAWNINAATATTNSNVTVNTRYTAVQNDKVTVTFTKLPENSGTLTIKEVKLTKGEQDAIGAFSDTAYDITSSMADGTFAYNLTLPIPDSAKGKKIEVKAAETVSDLPYAPSVDQPKAIENDVIKITGLNHFTIFTISADTNGATGTGAYTATTGPSIAESAAGQISTGTLILNVPSGFEFKTTASSVTATVTNGLCSGGGNKPVTINAGSGGGASSVSVTPTTTQISINVKQSSTGAAGCAGTITWSGIQTRPTAGTPLASGDITLSGTASIGSATFNPNTFTETAGAVSASASTVSASSGSIPADGSTTSTITVTLKDAFGNPVSGKTVSLSSSRGGSDTISAPSGSSSAGGVVTFTVKSSTPGSSIYTATDTTDSNLVVTQTASVTFTDVTPPTIPGTPTTASPTSNNKPTWTWTASTDNVGVDHYIFYWDTVAGGQTNNSGTIAAGTTSFTHSSSLADGTWYGKVKAFDAAGNSSVSGNGSVVVDTVAPTTSDSGIDTNWHNSNVTVTLTCSDGAGSGCANTYHTTDGSTPTTSSSTTNPFTLTTDGNYTIKYFSKDVAGNSEAVKTATNTVKIDKTNPVDPTVTSSSHTTSVWSNDNTIDVSWSGATDNLSGVAGYSYLFDTSPATAPDHISEGTGTSTTSSALSDGNSYYFHLATADNAGNWTSTVHLGPFFIDTTAPTTPSATPAAGDYQTAQSVTLASSDSSSGVASIYYTTDATTPSKTNGTLYSGSAISISKDTTLKAIAYDNAGNASAVLTATYGIAPVISAQTSSTVTSSSVTITWITDNPATSRVIYDTVSHAVLGAAPNYGYANSTVEDGTKVTSHSVVLSGLSSGTTYYYRTVSHGSPEAVSSEKSFITASNSSSTPSSSTSGGGGGGGGGAVLGAATGPSCNDTKPKGAPTLLSATASQNSASLTWLEALDPVSYYLVAYGTSPGAQSFGNPNVGGKGTTSFTVNNLSGGVTYYFKVRAGNGCTPGDYSNELSATPGGGVISGLAAGFSEGVLGTATPSANEKNMQEQKEQQTTKKVLGNEEKPNAEQGESFLASAKKYFPLIILLTFFILFFYWLLRMNKKRKF